MAQMIEQGAFTHGPVIVLSACEVGSTGVTLDGTTAGGIAGALVSAGAAAVLAASWPVEDVSMSYVVERFVSHLSNRGLRPAAALFRALFDLRRLTAPECLERCRSISDAMEKDGSADSQPESYLMLRNLARWIKKSPLLHPFDNVQLWGGLTVVGSGWGSPAGGMVGGAAEVERLIKGSSQREQARALLGRRRFAEAKALLIDILPIQDGLERASTLEALASATWGCRVSGAEPAARRETERLLAQAEVLARAEEDEQILRNIDATRKKLHRRASTHVPS